MRLVIPHPRRVLGLAWVAVGLRELAVAVVLCGGAYGAMMGSFWGESHPRAAQMIFSGVKVPLLLLGTFAMSVPFFFVVNTLLGLRADFSRVMRALLSAQAALTMVLASLGPFVLLFYASTNAYQIAILFNAFMFAIASGGGQVILRRRYRELIEKNPRHRMLLRAWLSIYAFIGIQMGWTLRPFVGEPQLASHFFRAEPFSNAYVALWQIARAALGW
jgi:hypothetical protein